MRTPRHNTVGLLLVGFVLGFVLSVAGCGRNAGGTYSLPVSNPTAGTTITASNETSLRNDVATELTDSLSRSGKGPMLAALELVNGSVGTPALSFDSDTDCGLYRVGANSVGMSVGGTSVMTWGTTGPAFPLGVPDGITVTRTTANSNGITATGNGTGYGGYFTGGSNGPGAIGVAVGGNNNGLSGVGFGTAAGVFGSGATAGNGAGVEGLGGGSGDGVVGTGGSSDGDGASFTGGATNGNGVVGTGTGTGSGGTFTSGSGAAVRGVIGALHASATGDSYAVFGSGTAAANGGGVRGTANGTGVAGSFSSSGSGEGVTAISSTGHGISTSANATGSALRIVPQSAQPSTTDEGSLYYDSDTDRLYVYAGGGWRELNTTP